MKSDTPTVPMDSGDPWSQDDDQGMPTSSPTPRAAAADDSPFRPTHPSQYQTPPPSPSPAASAARVTEGREAEEQLFPLAWLAIVAGPGGPRGELYPLQRETIVGRTTGHMQLGGDTTASGQHLKIKLETDEEGTQAFVLYDLASANGTYVGDYESCHKEENRVYRHLLTDGDFILVGRTILVFKQV